MSKYFTPDEIAKIRDAFAAQGCHDPSMNPIVQGPLRQDQMFYHSGTISIFCNGVSKSYQIETNDSQHMDTILQDIRSGFFNRS